MTEPDEDSAGMDTPTEVISQLIEESRATLTDPDESLDAVYARCEYARLRMIRHYQTEGSNPDDREEAITCLTEVLPFLQADPAADGATVASVLFLLADALGERHDENPRREDLDLSIACTMQGLDLLADEPDADWLLQLANLGIRTGVRYDKYDAASDFELARDALRTAYSYMEPDDEGARDFHFLLTQVCDTRYARTLDAADLDVSVEFLAEEWGRWPEAGIGLLYARRRLRRDGAGDVDAVLDVVQTILADESLPGEQRGTADRLAASAYWQRYLADTGARRTSSPDYRSTLRHAVAVIGNPQANADDLPRRG